MVAFFVVGVFHPLVVFVEYRFGKQAWWVMVLLWGTLELFWQHKRACLGRAKRNPARSPEYYSLKDRPH